MANPALRSMVQLILVKTSSGDMLEAAGDGLGPVLLEPDDAGYMLLARSVIGAVPAELDLGAEDFVCSWMLRMLYSTESSIDVGKQPTEHVLDANGYYVRTMVESSFDTRSIHRRRRGLMRKVRRRRAPRLPHQCRRRPCT